MNDLSYDIEQMYIDGLDPQSIADQLVCPISMVYNWINSAGVSGDDEMSPFATVNS